MMPALLKAFCGVVLIPWVLLLGFVWLALTHPFLALSLVVVLSALAFRYWRDVRRAEEREESGR